MAKAGNSSSDIEQLCAIEPIQFLGEIQPHGLLLEMSADWVISRASANVSDCFGKSLGAVIGAPAVELLGQSLLHDLRSRLQILTGQSHVDLIEAVHVPGLDRPYDVSIHRRGEAIIVELEPSHRLSDRYHHDIQQMLLRVRGTEDLKSLMRLAVRQIRALTAFDRVMFYQFQPDDSGEVVVESKISQLEPFEGLRYPASDIPPQARALYLVNPIRVIGDVAAQTVVVEPRLCPSGRPIDLSCAGLRAVSPTHIQYLKNMGVAASFSLSIVVEGKLWGLVACHHRGARIIPAALRQALSFYGSFLSSAVESLLRRDAAARRSTARAMHARILSRMSSDQGSIDNLYPLLRELSDELGADGLAVYVEGRLHLDGVTPSETEALELMQFLNRAAASRVYSTHSLRERYARATTMTSDVAGLLAVPVSRRPRDYIVFFRRELSKTVRWAGVPTKRPTMEQDGVLRLSPRASFAEWQETVRGESAHWSEADHDIAEALRITLLEIMLQLTDQAEKRRKISNDQQDLLIAELNHRVRNILNLIIGLVKQCADNASDVAVLSQDINDRVHALARAHDQLTSDGWGARSLWQMIRTEAGAYLGPKAERIILDGSDVAIQPDAFATIALVIHELITNSAKYGAFRDSRGVVKIRSHADATQGLIIDWKEEGGAVVTPPTRRGFGSTIIERAIPHELGGMAETAFERDGLKAQFVVPKRYIAEIAVEDAIVRVIDRDDAPRSHRLSGDVLLLEDNLLIAMEAESMLVAIGADNVLVASNVATALSYLQSHVPTFAVLDYNLGKEVSVPVAKRLVELEIPFVFATGYGDTSMIDEEFRSSPIITKPYTASRIIHVYDGLLSQMNASLNQIDVKQ